MTHLELPTGDKDLEVAYDGSSKRRPRRALKPLERELVVRLISDVLAQLRRSGGRPESLDACPIRLSDQDELNILINVRHAIDPRRD